MSSNKKREGRLASLTGSTRPYLTESANEIGVRALLGQPESRTDLGTVTGAGRTVFSPLRSHQGLPSLPMWDVGEF